MGIGKSLTRHTQFRSVRKTLRLSLAAVVSAALLLAGRSDAQEARPDGLAPVVAIDARLESTERTARFRMTLSRPVSIAFDSLAQPMRLVADLPDVALQASAAPRRAGGLVTGFRAGLVAPGRSRLVFDLARPAHAHSIRQVTRPDGVVDMTIEFQPQPEADFAAAVGQAADRRALAALAPLQISPQPPADRRPLVVIDPGHGGIDPGAVAAGSVMEKALVLTIAHKLKERLEASGTTRVLLTREDDRFLTLSERVRIAREARADLFISLHADSLSSSQEVRGATIYTGSDKATDAESATLAQKENAADALAGADAAQGVEDINDILLDLARRETRAQSGAVAARLVTSMSGAVKMHRIPQRAAGFRVLMAPDVPSILLELGFLSSKSDIALLTSAEWQRTAADAIARAVDQHFSARAAPRGKGASISPQL
jgi:N-acetylmuramoyl-L-alanine amidase